MLLVSPSREGFCGGVGHGLAVAEKNHRLRWVDGAGALGSDSLAKPTIIPANSLELADC